MANEFIFIIYGKYLPLCHTSKDNSIFLLSFQQELPQFFFHSKIPALGYSANSGFNTATLRLIFFDLCSVYHQHHHPRHHRPFTIGVSAPGGPDRLGGSGSANMCHGAVLATPSGSVITDEKGHTILSTEKCSWYQAHGLRPCAIGEAPIGQCYTP